MRKVKTVIQVNGNLYSRFYKLKRIFLIKLIIKHEKFNNVANGYDISLLKLDQYVSFTHEIQPACLPDKPNYPVLNSPGAIAGWGLTNASIRNVSKDLQNVKVKIADETFNKDCFRTQLALIENSIMCLGFVLFLKLIYLIGK